MVRYPFFLLFGAVFFIAACQEEGGEVTPTPQSVATATAAIQPAASPTQASAERSANRGEWSVAYPGSELTRSDARVEGSRVMAVAQGWATTADQGAILRFYHEELTARGWQAESQVPVVITTGADYGVLTLLSFVQNDDRVVVRLMLDPEQPDVQRNLVDLVQMPRPGPGQLPLSEDQAEEWFLYSYLRHFSEAAHCLWNVLVVHYPLDQLIDAVAVLGSYESLLILASGYPEEVAACGGPELG